MNKILFALLAFTLSSGVVYAQSSEKDELLEEYMKKEINELKEQLAKKGSECDSLNEVIKELRKTVDALNKDAKKFQEVSAKLKKSESAIASQATIFCQHLKNCFGIYDKELKKLMPKDSLRW